MGWYHLGQAQDYTAIAIVDRIDMPPTAKARRMEYTYHLRYLHRPPLGTRYPDIVNHVLGLLGQTPLTRQTPLIVDKTGVGSAVVDMFAAQGVRPRAVTITGGSEANREDPYNLKVPKRELASTLVALYQGRRLKTAEGLELAPTLLNELVNFKVKINIATANETYEAWRESIHDDLVLAVALACWYGEHVLGRPHNAVWGGERTIIRPFNAPAGGERSSFGPDPRLRPGANRRHEQSCAIRVPPGGYRKLE
jgi:hypothetical protein